MCGLPSKLTSQADSLPVRVAHIYLAHSAQCASSSYGLIQGSRRAGRVSSLREDSQRYSSHSDHRSALSQTSDGEQSHSCIECRGVEAS